jgi:alkylation response protein AidB-like acyl-CoA dehydrogenase
MDLEYGPRYEEFRREIRAFLDEHKPKQPLASLAREGRAELVRWLSLQIEHGYWARTIPREYGGYGAPPDLLETVIMDEEFNRAGVPRGMMAQGPSMLAPTLLEHGTEEQKRRWIGPTMRAEVLWCQGYSEPGAGSDLASLQTSRRLPDQRPEDLDQHRRQIGHDLPAGSHGAGSLEARGHQLRPGADGHAGHRGPAFADDVRRPR